ncbi:aldehyde dehydrogenase family protein [Phanerochaete sordida]|uniref:Aldehyde dehydrogenase family protein n=1 Tax=Phanerochaete sordida TaxID=48140 RepID=A0A9P3LHG0_9APHY|nr:aldehyde dehydrogenase family protein [Phanerochaete sordida]
MPGTWTHEFKTDLFKGSAQVNTGLFINGKWVDPVDGETIDVYNPADGSVIGKVSCGSAKDIDLAVNAAKAAYKSSWGLKVPGFERGRLLYKLAELLEKNADSLAAIEALDAGKSFQHARHMDVQDAINNLRYYAGWADKTHGQTIETTEAKFAYTRHEPIGVVGLIVPWNFPLMIAVWKIAPALATGNTIVLKQSEVTPLSALKLAEFIKEAGFPDGVFNVVTGFGQTAGQALTEHPLVGKVSFTGSTLIGRKVMETAAKTNLKRVTLELGGKSPTIVFDDADLEQSVKWVCAALFHHSGQMCAAGTRIFVQEGIYDTFLRALAGAAASIQQGDGFAKSTQQGPVVSQVQLERVLSYIESGKQEGATLVAGGARRPGAGYFVQPTIFADVKPDMKIVREEIFGPVGVVVKFKTEEEAIEAANDTEYGLSSYVYTQNVSRAIRVSNAIEAGTCFVNVGSVLCPQVPFGGYKQSGHGKEMGEYALEAFTQVKAVHINLGMNL